MRKLRRGRVRYVVDNFMSKGGLSVFLALISLFILAILVLTGLRYLANLAVPQEGMTDLETQSWLTFMQVADGGAIAEDTGHNWLNRIVGVIALFIGLVLFSSLIAFITSQFEERIASLKKGKSKVLEKGHTIILGCNDRSIEIIQELAIAMESERRPCIVILSEMEKDEMDDLLRERLGGLKKVRLITRNGSTSNIHILNKMALSQAKSIIILNDANPSDELENIKACDARVIKSLMAVESITGGKIGAVVAEIHQESKRKLAQANFPKISIINEESILAKLMVQTSRISGLAQVYDMLVGFKGCEFYFTPVKKSLLGSSFYDAAMLSPDCSVIGVEDKNGNVTINPKPDRVLSEGESLIVIAEDDSLISFSDAKQFSKFKDNSASARHEKKIEHQLIVGWNTKAPLVVEEYSQYLVDGSKLIIVTKDFHEELTNLIEELKAKYQKLVIEVINKDIHEPGVIEELKPEQFDNVIILSEENNSPELSDAETITALLEFRQYFKRLNQKELRTQLITEVADSENIQLIEDAGVRDFLISNQFVSRMYAQVSEDPKVLKIYDELFKAEGSEVYIKPVSYFTSRHEETFTFGEMVSAALNRNEVCVGLRLGDLAEDRERDYGFVINPKKSDRFQLGPRDFLVTIAEDET